MTPAARPPAIRGTENKMTKITKLTSEQEAELPAFRERAREMALKPHFASDDDMRAAVIDLYLARGLKAPTVFVFADPVQCLWARSLLGVRLGDQLWVQLGVRLGDQLGDQLGDVHDTLWFAGGSEFYWIAFYKFAEHIGVKYSAEHSAALLAWSRYAEVCGPLYPYGGMAFVSRRPELVSFDEVRRLHADTGPALRFESGYSIHAWHGVRIPSEWAEKPASLTPTVALTWEHVEQRRVAIQHLGYDAVLSACNAREIDVDPDPLHGRLIEVDLPLGDEPVRARFLRAMCGTGREFVIPVDPSCQTVLGAQAWIKNVPEATFTYPEIRH